MIHKDKQIRELSDVHFIHNLAFLTDITGHLNELNLKLQGSDQLVTEMYSHILAFERKLDLWKSQIKVKNFIHFKCLDKVNKQFESIDFDFESVANVIENLKIQFQQRFDDFENEKFVFNLFTEPFDISVNEAPDAIQMELIKLQANNGLKTKFINKLSLNFTFIFLNIFRNLSIKLKLKLML